MLDDYKDGQPIAYKLLTKIVKNNESGHAYLIQTNGYYLSKEVIMAFVKSLFCPNHYTNREYCNNCQICSRIDQGNFPELKVIEPDGLWIKKEQLISLQQKFSTKAVESDKKIYIIYEAEKLNSAAANSILKFLEEPEENIIAILVTDDIHQVLKTISSRCQIIILKPNILEESIKNYQEVSNTTLLKFGLITLKNKEELNKFLLDAKIVEKIEAVIKFIKKYEKDKLDILLDSKNLWHNYFEEKESQILAFEIMILFYKDVLNYLCGRELDIFDYYIEDIKIVATLNNIKKITNKLNKILITKEKINNNVNSNLLLDKLIINMEGEVNL